MIKNGRTIDGINEAGEGEKKIADGFRYVKRELQDTKVMAGLCRKLMEHDCTYYYAEREYDGMLHQMKNIDRHIENIEFMISLCDTYEMTKELKYVLRMDIEAYKQRTVRVKSMAQDLMLKYSHFSRTIKEIVDTHGSMEEYLKQLRKKLKEQADVKIVVDEVILAAYSDLCKKRMNKYGDTLDDAICEQLELKAEEEQKIAYMKDINLQRKKEAEQKEKELQDKKAKNMRAINDAILQKAEQEYSIASYIRKIKYISSNAELKESVVADLLDEYHACAKKYTHMDNEVLDISSYAEFGSTEFRIDKRLGSEAKRVTEFLVEEAPELALLLKSRVKQFGNFGKNRSCKLMSFIDRQLYLMRKHDTDKTYILLGFTALASETIGKGEVTFSSFNRDSGEFEMRPLGKTDVLNLLAYSDAFADLESAEAFADSYEVIDDNDNCRRKAIVYTINKQVILNLIRLAGGFYTVRNCVKGLADSDSELCRHLEKNNVESTYKCSSEQMRLSRERAVSDIRELLAVEFKDKLWEQRAEVRERAVKFARYAIGVMSTCDKAYMLVGCRNKVKIGSDAPDTLTVFTIGQVGGVDTLIDCGSRTSIVENIDNIKIGLTVDDVQCDGIYRGQYSIEGEKCVDRYENVAIEVKRELFEMVIRSYERKLTPDGIGYLI